MSSEPNPIVYERSPLPVPPSYEECVSATAVSHANYDCVISPLALVTLFDDEGDF
jgi:hypothetical protein